MIEADPLNFGFRFGLSLAAGSVFVSKSV